MIMRIRTGTVTLALAASTMLAACSGEDAPAPTSGAPSPAGFPSPSQVAAPLPSDPAPSDPAPSGPASPTPAGGEGSGLVLGGVDLGATTLGAPFPQAVAAITSVLGAPIENPADGVACIQSTMEVQWEGFRLAEGSGAAAAGWVSSSSTLQTPSGVTRGTELATLERVYGADLRIFPPNTDNTRRTFEIEGADVLGSLNDDDTVRSLYSSFCSGP